MLLERSREVQNYIEDCEVCCQPIQIEYLFQKEVERFILYLAVILFSIYLTSVLCNFGL